MNPALLNVAFALVTTQALWACALLVFWLARHRKMTCLPYRGPRRRRAPPSSHRSGPGHHRAKDDWVARKVIYLASHLGSCRQVQAAFNRAYGYCETVGHTFVWEVMRDHAEEIRQLRRERKRRRPSFTPVGHTWALDLTFIRSHSGLTFTVLAIIDAGSRKLLALKVLPRKCAFQLLGHVLLACSEHGVPEIIRSDNEAMFTSLPWLAALKARGIRNRPCTTFASRRPRRCKVLWMRSRGSTTLFVRAKPWPA
ncbi:DDE-type integrase/transposase/recombinase [Piscinibacter terrae]|nr:DDE-type integrase/transposase/recombinase [Albitalea terrae]